MHFAAINGTTSVAALLLINGASVDVSDKASAPGSADVLTALTPMCPLQEGKLPSDLAAATQHDDVLRLIESARRRLSGGEGSSEPAAPADAAKETGAGAAHRAHPAGVQASAAQQEANVAAEEEAPPTAPKKPAAKKQAHAYDSEL